LFFLHPSRLHPCLHSFPTRRSSDLLARALVNRPLLLLLDEPLSALDANLRKEMQSELKALQRKVGITFLFVTHDQEEAMALSDRSEEHTSELQSLAYLVCRLLLEKK